MGTPLQQHSSKKNNRYQLLYTYVCRGRLKCDGTCQETRLRLSAKWTNRFKSAGWVVSSVDYWQPRCAHQLLLLVVMLEHHVLR